jgi:hypothetical protein
MTSPFSSVCFASTIGGSLTDLLKLFSLLSDIRFASLLEANRKSGTLCVAILLGVVFIGLVISFSLLNSFSDLMFNDLA